MKRRMTTLLLGAILCCTSFAQSEVEKMLQTVSTKRVSLDYDFSSIGNTTIKGSGSLIINGNCFKSNGNGLEISCDGSTRWTIDNFAKEVYIENASGTSDFLSNPEVFLNNVTSISISGKKISGIWKDPANGIESEFTLSNIKESELKEDCSEFTFDTTAIGSGWVVTDLR